MHVPLRVPPQLRERVGAHPRQPSVCVGPTAPPSPRSANQRAASTGSRRLFARPCTRVQTHAGLFMKLCAARPHPAGARQRPQPTDMYSNCSVRSRDGHVRLFDEATGAMSYSLYPDRTYNSCQISYPPSNARFICTANTQILGGTQSSMHNRVATAVAVAVVARFKWIKQCLTLRRRRSAGGWPLMLACAAAQQHKSQTEYNVDMSARARIPPNVRRQRRDTVVGN